MSKQEITDKIFEIVCKKIRIEKEFGISIPDNIEIEDSSIASVVDYIDTITNTKK